MTRTRPAKLQILERNQLEYDAAADAYWRLTVYEAVHEGWWFANIGGRHVLDFIAREAHLSPESRLLELCCGLADTCRYFASTVGCRVTGVEINPHQIEQAKIRLQQCAPRSCRDLIRLVRADVLNWRPEESYDVVYAIDSLMLLEDRAGVLEQARDALVAGGSLMIADVLAGPRLDDAIREFIWQEDGILDLPALGEQRSLLGELGFSNLRGHDIMHLAESCFTNIILATQRHRDTLVAAKGHARYSRWLRNAHIYRDCFRQRRLVYALLAADLV